MMRSTIRRSAIVAVIGTVISCSPAVSLAVELWGILPATNQIVRVDPLTGNVFGGFSPPGGALMPAQLFGGLTIAEEGDVLLYQNPVTNPTNLFRLNPDTGALLSTETMPPAGNPDFRAGLSFESGAGVAGADAIFAVNDGAPVQRQDGYGDLTLANHVPDGATFAGALGGDDNGRHFLAAIVQTGSIWEFDPATPNVILNTLPAPLGFDTPVGGLAFDGQRIYLSAFDGRLWTLDPDTGAVLNLAQVDEGGLIGLAARRVPEPSALMLAMFGCAGVLILKKSGYECR